MYVIQNPDQILPIAVIHCGVGEDEPTPGGASGPSGNGQIRVAYDPDREAEEINKKMAKLFENSLKMHLTGQYMMACDAISTQLYPHQMYALAWMMNRENAEKIEVRGGILADDMGLGKTLTILSLIMTNFHDKRPLQKPITGKISLCSLEGG